MSLQSLGERISKSAVNVLGTIITYNKDSATTARIRGVFSRPDETAQFEGGEIVGAQYELRVKTDDISGITRTSSSFVVNIDGTATTLYPSAILKTGYGMSRIILRS
jgi:hypothetical protein